MRLLAIVLGLWATTALADDTIRHFDIPAQSLSQALLIYGKQAGVSITVSDDLPGATEGLKGNYTREAALEQLLAGTGLQFEWVAEGAVAVTEIGSAPRPKSPPVTYVSYVDAIEEIRVTARKREESLLGE